MTNIANAPFLTDQERDVLADIIETYEHVIAKTTDDDTQRICNERAKLLQTILDRDAGCIAVNNSSNDPDEVIITLKRVDAEYLAGPRPEYSPQREARIETATRAALRVQPRTKR